MRQCEASASCKDKIVIGKNCTNLKKGCFKPEVDFEGNRLCLALQNLCKFDEVSLTYDNVNFVKRVFAIS